MRARIFTIEVLRVPPGREGCMSISGVPARSAVIHLRGHTAIPAHLEVTRFPLPAWIGRIVLHIVGWLAGTWTTLILTFDPFVAFFPFVIGMGLVYRTVRGRYRVQAFGGRCPRCSGKLQLKPGSKIALPYPIVCYGCHHESELRLLGQVGAYRRSGETVRATAG